MYANVSKEIVYEDVAARLSPRIEGYKACIREVDVIESGRQKLVLITLTGSANKVNFELKKFLKYELRTGNILCNLLSAVNKLPEKGQSVDLDDLCDSIVKIYVEDRQDNDGNIISYVKKIEPCADMPTPLKPPKNNSQDNESEIEDNGEEGFSDQTEIYEPKDDWQEEQPKPIKPIQKRPNLKPSAKPVQE